MSPSTSNVRKIHSRQPAVVPIPPDLPDDLADIIGEGDDLTEKLEFANDVWNLRDTTSFANSPSTGVHFEQVPARYRDAVKLYAIALSNPSAVAALEGVDAELLHAFVEDRTTNWRTTHGSVANVKRALSELVDQFGEHPQLNDSDWKRVADQWRKATYIKDGAVAHRQATTLRHYARVLRQLSDVCTALGSNSPVFGTRPFGDDSLDVRFPSTENERRGHYRNKVRPVGRVFKLLGADRNYVTVTADDLVSRAEWWTNRITKTHPNKSTYCPVETWRAALDVWEAAGFTTLPTRPTIAGSKPTGDIKKVLGEGRTIATEVVLQFAGWEPRKPKPDQLKETIDSGRFTFVDVCDHDDPYSVETGTPHPAWLADDLHLLPTTQYDPTGLWVHTTALAWACHNGLMTSLALRDMEIESLEPDCLKERDLGDGMRRWIDGVKIKSQDVQNPPATKWYVAPHNMVWVTTAKALRDAFGLPDEKHRRNGRKMLFTDSLLRHGHERKHLNNMEHEFFKQKRGVLLGPYEGLARTGFGRSLEGVEYVTPRECRISALSAMANIQHGLLAVQAHSQHANVNTTLGYVGHVTASTSNTPQPWNIFDPAELDPFGREGISTLINPQLEDVREQQLEDGDVRVVIETAVNFPGRLSGPGAATVNRRMANDGILNHQGAPAVVSDRQFERLLTKGSVSGLLVGSFSICSTSSGGLCEDDTDARVRRCVLGCHNQAFTPSLRALLELERRRLKTLIAKQVNPAVAKRGVAKIDQNGDIIGDLREATDEELVEVFADGLNEDDLALMQQVVDRILATDEGDPS